MSVTRPSIFKCYPNTTNIICICPAWLACCPSREYVLAFAIWDENNSFMLERNIQKFLPKIAANASAMEAFTAGPEPNLMHGINGYLYCNLPGLEFVQGESARIYFMAIGTAADMHTPNSAESQLFLDGHRKQAVSLLPGSMMTVDTT